MDSLITLTDSEVRARCGDEGYEYFFLSLISLDPTVDKIQTSIDIIYKADKMFQNNTRQLTLDI